MLYSFKGSTPTEIPFRIRLPNGLTRTDPSTFTQEEITIAGYIPCDYPPTVTQSELLSWDSSTLQWVVRAKTEEELYAEYLFSVPKTVTMRQARLALESQGLLDTINSAIASLEGDEGIAARIEWEYATEIDRDNTLFQSLKSTIGLTDQQTYDLFILAATL